MTEGARCVLKGASGRVARRLRLRDERGNAVVWLAISLPLLLIIGTFAVDVGNWVTHRRHLQTQADAAALAGGSVWSLPCTDSVNTGIVGTARNYAGPSATNPTAQFNAQVGGTPSSRLHVVLNSTDFFDQGGSDFSDGPDQSAAQPCQKGYLDVKITESNLPWFFNLAGAGLIPAIHAQARVKLAPVIGERGFLPLGVPDTRIFQARATYVNGCDGTVLGTADLTPLNPQPPGTPQGLTAWGPTTGTFALAKPNGTTCGARDYVPIDVNVAVAGSPTADITACGTRFVECFTAIDELRLWKTGNATTGPPTFHDVHLTPLSCNPSAYYASDLSGPLPCTYAVSVDVDWGDRIGTGTDAATFSATVTVNGTALTPPGGWNGTWTGVGLPTAAAGVDPVNLTWSWVRTRGTWRGARCNNNNGNGQNANPCKESSPAPIQIQRTYAAPSDTTPIGSITAPFDSTPYDALPATQQVTTTVGLQGDLLVGQKRLLRLGQSQGNQTLQCDPDYTNGFDVTALALGCKPFYGRNGLTANWTANGVRWEDCPTPTNTWFRYPQASPYQIWYCTLAGPGLSPNQVADGAAITTGNCAGINYAGTPPQPKSCNRTVCLHPNYWSRYRLGPPNDPALNPQDPRIVKLFVVPFGVLKNTNANDPIEVVDFAEYYITGWEGQGNGNNQDPCLNNMPADEQPKANGVPIPGAIVGHFIKKIEPNNAIADPNGTCDPNSPAPCVVVLVR